MADPGSTDPPGWKYQPLAVWNVLDLRAGTDLGVYSERAPEKINRGRNARPDFCERKVWKVRFVEVIERFAQRQNGKLKKIKPYAEILCDTKEDLEFVKAAVDAYPGWRGIDESLPEPGKHVLLSFENEGVTIPDIGTYEVDEQGNGAFYPSDCEATYASVGVFVNAWMPLPKPYKREEEKQNEAD